MIVANLRAHGRRMLAAGLAVTLGTAFLALVLAIGATFGATIGRYAAGSVGDAAVVVTNEQPFSPRLVEQVRRLPGVTATRALRVDSVTQDLGGRQGPAVIQTLPHRLGTLTGRRPSAVGEVLATQEAATARSLSVGSRVTLVGGRGQHVVAVVGIAAPDRADLAQPGMLTFLAEEPTIAQVTGRGGFTELAIDGSVTPAAVQALAPGLTVRSGAAEREHRVSQLAAGTDALTAIFSGFAAIALFVAALVIANSFTIVLAQRARELALLRCVGATRGQVRRTVYGEAAVVGLVGSVLGVGLGLVLGVAAVTLSAGSPMALAPLVVTPAALVVPVLVGLAVTLAAAVLPTRRATLVAPVEALRPAAPATDRASRRRVAAGLVLTVLGAAALVGGAVIHAVALAMLGGAVSFVGVLVLGPVLVPACVRLLGLVLRRAGVPGELAVDTASRHPSRTAATSSALLVGVTLITVMSVASLSGQRTVEADLAAHAPVDLVASATSPLTSAQVEDLRGVPGVALVSAAGPVEGAVVRSGERTLTPDSVTVLADPGAVRVTDVAEALRHGEAVLGSGLDADRVQVSAGGRSLDLPVHRSSVLGRATVLLPGGRGIEATRRTAWLRLTDDADVTTTSEAAAKRLSGTPGVQVSGPATQRVEMQKVADGVLMVVTGLLGVAVLIALVGIGNTLSLGVLERTREIGLLRALGLSRRAVRASIGLEALAVAAVAALLGVLLGIGYGIAAAHAVLGGVGQVVIAMPWERLGVIVVVALLAGWLASVLPARRAARVAPSVALASE